MSSNGKTPMRPRKALVVGGGPVGALTAASLHKRGWEVELWESRDGELPPARLFKILFLPRCVVWVALTQPQRPPRTFHCNDQPPFN